VIEEYSVLSSIFLTKKNPFDSFHNCHVPDQRRCVYTGQLLDNPLAKSLGIYPTTFYNYGTILESFTKMAGLPVVNVAPKLYLPERAIQLADQLSLPARYIVIHCHSNYTPKDWQSYHWDKLVDDLTRTFNIHVVEVGLKSTLSGHQTGYHNLCGQLSLLETAEVIKRADYFIGVDSGPAHLANSVGTFGFLLFGKLGDFTNYMPYSGDYQAMTNVQFIQSEQGQPCSELSYDAVWPVVRDTIKQREAVDSMSHRPMSFS
jgi:heptosyltransferase-3